MADKEQNKTEREEKKIPVFTVLKNGGILKNIFLLDHPPPFSEPKCIQSGEERRNSIQENEEILLVGRHPDCNIVLTHPSVSRFHLRIHSKPSLQKLSVIDLSSAHGTWVSGGKIESQIPVEISEGDTLRFGVSTRNYRLHWIPLNRAFDMESSLISPPYALALPPEEKEDIDQDENSMSLLQKLIPSAPPLPPESMDSLFSEEGEFMSAPEMLEERESRSLSKRRLEQKEFSTLWYEPLQTESVNSSSLPVDTVLSETTYQQFNKEEDEEEEENEEENDEEEEEEEEEENDENTELVNSSLLVDTALSEAIIQQFFKEQEEEGEKEEENHENKEEDKGEILPESEVSEDEEENDEKTKLVNSSLPVDTAFSETIIHQFIKEQEEEGEKEEENHENKEEEEEANGEILPESEASEGEEQSPLGRTLEQEISSLCCGPLATESVNSSQPTERVLSEISNPQFRKENISPEGFTVSGRISTLKNQENSPEKLVQKQDMASIWSRRGKPTSVLQIQTGRSRGENQREIKNRVISKVLFCGSDGEEELFTPDKENFTPNTLLTLKYMKNSKVDDEIKHSKPFGSSSLKGTNKPYTESEELFTPNKENFTPNTLARLKSMKKAKVDEIKHTKAFRMSSSKGRIDPNIEPEEEISFCSGKKNLTPKVLQDLKSEKLTSTNHKRRDKRVPFQSLSSGKSDSEASFPNAIRSSNSMSYAQSINNLSYSQSVGEVKRKWNMVVDTNCLLNNESRKSLKLLQGLKGTQLIIPRIVIRELDCLKWRGGLFGSTKEASAALQWIEECMLKMKWWIHVQSSGEEGMPIAPTPPASPRSRLSIGSYGGFTNSSPFSSSASLMEIVSPTAEDHVLECAIFFKRMKNDEQFIILSNDVTLNIKAMAEGLICETAEAFRESLVNPYSERFLWRESTPRGATWSCLDDVVLKEKYYQFPMKKKTSKASESAKGLKLILLHNSHYGQINSAN